MAALPELRVVKHAEGAVQDVEVKIHGAPVAFTDNEGVADPGSNPSFVQFGFAAKPGAAPGVRFRVEIRSGAAIVYREEVQLPPNGGAYDSGYRWFAV